MHVFVPLLNQDQYNRALGNLPRPTFHSSSSAASSTSFRWERAGSFMSNASYPVDLLLGGWQVSGITTIQHRRAAGGHRRHQQQRRAELGL